MAQVIQLKSVPGYKNPNVNRKSAKQLALDFLAEVQTLPPEVQDSPAALMAHFNVSKPTLYRWFSDLTKSGLLPRKSRETPLSASLAAMKAGPTISEAPIKLAARLPDVKSESLATKEHGLSKSEGPKNVAARLEVEAPARKSIELGRETSSLAPMKLGPSVAEQPKNVAARLPAPAAEDTELAKKKKKKKQKEKKESLRAREADETSPAAAVDRELVIELEAGLLKPNQVAIMARNDKLTSGDKAKLRGCKDDPAMEYFWLAYMAGVKTGIKDQYRALWNSNCPGKFEHLERGKNYQAVWDKVAEAIIETTMDITDYLHRANDSKPAKLKIIPLHWLGSDSTVTSVLAWASPEDRAKEAREKRERTDFDGMTLAEIQERTRLAGV